MKIALYYSIALANYCANQKGPKEKKNRLLYFAMLKKKKRIFLFYDENLQIQNDYWIEYSND